ncbi:MAG: hypothetical protein ACREGJ_00535 [Candidatus Saccharimonadales bacterium]
MSAEQHATHPESARAKKPRPYWHVDFKWITGLLLTVVLGVWLLVLVAYQITAPKPGIDITTNLMSSAFTREGQDDAKGLEELRAKIAESPDKTFRPFPGMPVAITEKDLELSPQQIRDKIFRQITEPLYYKGARGLAEEFTSDKAAQDKFVNDAGLISIISQERHRQLGDIAWKLGVVVLLLTAAVVYFSHRWGRLVTPGIILLLVSVPGLLIFSGLKQAILSPAEQPTQPTNEEDGAAFIQLMIANAKGAFAPAAEIGQSTYLLGLQIALALLAAALIAKIVFVVIAKVRAKQTA